MIDLFKQFFFEYLPDIKALGYAFVSFLVTHLVWKKKTNGKPDAGN